VLLGSLASGASFLVKLCLQFIPPGKKPISHKTERSLVVDEILKKRRTLQETMNFMAALSAGIEPILGRGANSMTMSAGRNLGRKFSAGVKPTQDLMEAIDEVRNILVANNCLWGFEPFKPQQQKDFVISTPEGDQQLLLVFRDCMIRQALLRFGHPQQGSLCNMMYGFFAGALESIMGRKTTLEIKHAGENSCLKLLTVKK
jgi:predicted hydrocarbon binding protein